MVHLSVNVNKIATLRNSRGGNIPHLLQHIELILETGAHGITVHPRSDERHITRQDVKDISFFLKDYNKLSPSRIEYNLEGELSERFLGIVLDTLPDQATLVPVTPGEITSDHGFDFRKERTELEKYIREIKKAGIRTSLFVETDLDNLKQSKDIGADRVEFYTGPFAEAYDEGKGFHSYQFYKEAAELAISLGYQINAGHDLDHKNLSLFRNLPGLKEVSIGHRLISYSLSVGLSQAVREYLKILEGEA
jgi:pyridoxine 5-phosphate synthase